MRDQFKIISWEHRSFWTPRVAWNSYRNEYMVVWNAFDTTTGFPPGSPKQIAGARVTNQDGGKVIDTDVMAIYDNPHQVDIAYNPNAGQYLIVYVVIHTTATSGNDIYGQRVTAEGAVTGGLITIYEDNTPGQRKHQNHPAVATSGLDRYMVVWEHEYSTTDHDIFGREYGAYGTPIDDAFPVCQWVENDTAPDVAANGSSNEWLAVWQRELPSSTGYSIHGRRWGSPHWHSGDTVTSYWVDVVDWVFYESKNPAVASGPPGYLITYEMLGPPGLRSQRASLSTSTQHIWGRMWWPEALHLPLLRRAVRD
jgi:hypothetical protein